MPSVFVTALKPLIYQGRSHVQGEVFQVRPIDGAVMARRGDVDLTVRHGTRVLQTREMQPEPSSEPVPVVRPRRRYRRRDMTAEGTSE